mmetsp:Transcript_11750/g.40156  ORF Transcript_11750/g.40156 Transcript_11750/m.40156 type:complete len:558 (+) Transcript_11750:410-2083(+)
MRSLDSGTVPNLFIHALAGAGKTYLLDTMSQELIARNFTVVVTAASGVAALNLKTGQTFHSAFGIRPNASDEPTERHAYLNINRKSKLARKLRDMQALVVDEIAMLDRFLYEMAEATVRNLYAAQDDDEHAKACLFFAGKGNILCGDFGQLLPVVPGGDRATVVHRAMSASPLVKEHFYHMCLAENVRARRAGEELNDPEGAAAYAAFLRDLHDNIPPGTAPITTDREADIVAGDADIPQARGNAATEGAHLPTHVGGHPFALRDGTPEELMDFVYGDLRARWHDTTWLAERAIVAGKYEDVDFYNDAMTTRYLAAREAAGREVEALDLYSADTLADDTVSDMDAQADADTVTAEDLATRGRGHVPPHHLRVAPGMPLMLLRNVNMGRGLCNGTKLIAVKVTRAVIMCRIVSGPRAFSDELVPIFRCSLRCEASHGFPAWERLQFPVRVCWAHTVHKAQGQTLKCVGGDLRTPPFAHAMLYVLCGRVGHASRIRIILPPSGHTANPVYIEAMPDAFMPLGALTRARVTRTLNEILCPTRNAVHSKSVGSEESSSDTE